MKIKMKIPVIRVSLLWVLICVSLVQTFGRWLSDMWLKFWFRLAVSTFIVVAAALFMLFLISAFVRAYVMNGP